MFNGMKAVIFDMDGTLIDSLGVWAEIDQDFLDKRQILVPENIQKAIEGLSFMETVLYFKENFQLEESVDEIYRELIEMSIEHYRQKIPLKSGAKEFVSSLYQKGMSIGLATSSQHLLVEAVLERHELQRYFTSIRTSCDVGRGKPFPDVFLKVAEDLQVKPAECLVFEDTVAGVMAAKRAGMKVIAVFDNNSLPDMDEIGQLADGYIVNFKGIA